MPAHRSKPASKANKAPRAKASNLTPRTGNGLKLRPDADTGATRPRFEPWPAARAIGIRGKDLKDLHGAWLSRGQAIDAADARALWSRALIDAHKVGTKAAETAREALQQALAGLSTPTTPAAIQARALVQDLIDQAKAVLLGDLQAPATKSGQNTAPLAISGIEGKPWEGKPWRAFAHAPDQVPAHWRSVEALLDLWQRDPHEGVLSKSAGTQKSYGVQIRKLIEDMGPTMAASITVQEAKAKTRAWAKAYSVNTIAMMVAVAAGAWKWGRWQGWLMGDSPWSDLGLEKPEGRIVIWSPDQTRDLCAWCDANGFWDVADAITILEWTGQRPGDYCAATLDDLNPDRPAWHIKAQGKTKATARPGFVPQVIARLKARPHRAANGQIGRAISPMHRFYAIDPTNGQRHTPDSLRARYKAALKAAAKADPATFQPIIDADLHLQDLRDTCVTRLYAANVDKRRMCDWTGHSEKSCERIWRQAYVQKLDLNAQDTAAALSAFTARLG